MVNGLVRDKIGLGRKHRGIIMVFVLGLRITTTNLMKANESEKFRCKLQLYATADRKGFNSAFGVIYYQQ